MNRRNFLLKSTLTGLAAAASWSPLAQMARAEGQSKEQTLLLSQTVHPRVIVAPDATKSELYAVQELVTYLEKMTGQLLVIEQTAQSPVASPQNPLIVVGAHPLNSELAQMIGEMEETIVEVKPGLLRLVGGKPIAVKLPDGTTSLQDRGALYAVYNLLDELGVRWYRPEEWGEHVPRANSIELSLGRRRYKPVYPWRQGFSGYRYVTDQTDAQKEMAVKWIVRNRLNTNNGAEEEQGGRRRVQTWEIYDGLFPASQYFAQHPEYFALIDGKRRKDGQLCVSNPEVQRLTAEKVIAGYRQNPRWETMSIEANDSVLWCQCEDCKAMDDPLQEVVDKSPPRLAGERPMGNVCMSNRVNKFGTIVSGIVAKTHPEIRILWLAYSAHTEVPSQVHDLPSNTIIQVCAVTSAFRDASHSYSDYSKNLFDATSEPNRNLVRVLSGYGKMTRLMTREYWGGLGWMGPMPLIRTMKDRLQSYRKFPIEGLYNESYYHWGPQGINFYFMTRLLWNPDLDIEKELDLYCKNYYGPAYLPMRSYHELLEDAAHAGIPFHALGVGTHAIFTPAVTSRMTELIDEAKTLIGDREPYKKRFEGVWAGYEYTRLVLPYFDYLKVGDKLEAAKAWERANRLILSYKDGSVFDNGVFFGSLQFFGGYNLNIPAEIQREAKKQIASEYSVK